MAELFDSIGRRIHYLRVAVTDRCNFRCRYCMPPEGVTWLQPEQILSYEELLRIIGAFAELGVDKVRITGGEPLVRRGLVPFVRQVKQIAGIKEVALTTNGSLLGEYAKGLKEAGVDRLNISLDTLRRKRFKELTGQDALDKVLAGIQLAQQVGLTPVKINMVVMKGQNDDEIIELAKLALTNPYQIRFIEYMPFSGNNGYLLTAAEMKKKLLEAGFPELLPEAAGSCPAKIYKIAGSKGSIGFITPVSQHFCESCNRIRLTPDGCLKPCLLSNEEYSLRDFLRSGADDKQLKEFIRDVIWHKPQQHHLAKGQYSERKMSRIGG